MTMINTLLKALDDCISTLNRSEKTYRYVSAWHQYPVVDSPPSDSTLNKPPILYPVLHHEDALSTDRTERLLVDQPGIHAVAVEKVTAAQRFDLVVLLKIAQTNGAGTLTLGIHVFGVKTRGFDLFDVVLAMVLLDLAPNRRDERDQKPASPEKQECLAFNKPCIATNKNISTFSHQVAGRSTSKHKQSHTLEIGADRSGDTAVIFQHVENLVTTLVQNPYYRDCDLNGHNPRSRQTLKSSLSSASTISKLSNQLMGEFITTAPIAPASWTYKRHW